MTLVAENDVQPAKQQSMMTVMMTSAVVKNPGERRREAGISGIVFPDAGRLLFNPNKRGVNDFRHHG
jgi:hypothetical protein